MYSWVKEPKGWGSTACKSATIGPPIWDFAFAPMRPEAQSLGVYSLEVFSSRASAVGFRLAFIELERTLWESTIWKSTVLGRQSYGTHWIGSLQVGFQSSRATDFGSRCVWKAPCWQYTIRCAQISGLRFLISPRTHMCFRNDMEGPSK